MTQTGSTLRATEASPRRRKRDKERLPRVKLPAEPLLSRFGHNTDSLAKAAGVSRRQVQRWIHDGLDFDSADKACREAGETACVVWPEFHDTFGEEWVELSPLA